MQLQGEGMNWVVTQGGRTSITSTHKAACTTGAILSSACMKNTKE